MPRAATAVLLLLLSGAVAQAEVPLERTGRVETLPSPLGAHWVFVADILLQRSALLDLDRGSFLGMISTGYGPQSAFFPRARREFYLPETYYSRGSRGTRTDVVTVYDIDSLAPVAEIGIPAKRAMNVLPSANNALSDDDRFLAVFNMTPATSLSIVDVEQRRFVGEVATPGCSLVYAAGVRSFVMLCADGALLSVTVDDAGQLVEKVRTPPFFDPQTDPVTEKAVRRGDRWYFVSFEGIVYPIDVSGDLPRLEEPWSLIDEADRAKSWRIGGSQHLTVHEASGRLYSLVHQGGVDTVKDPAVEVWVYDLDTAARIQRIKLRHPGFAFLTATLSFGESWIWPLNRLSSWLLDYVLPNPGLDSVQVTQDDEPLLITGTTFSGSLAVYDALNGEFLRRVATGNLSTHSLQVPWSRGEPGP